MATPNVPVTTLARLFNLTERRVQQLSRDGIISKPEKGKYDLIACVQSYIKYLQDRAMGRGAIEPQDAHLERARLLKAQADKTELEVKSLSGEVVPSEQVELLWSGLVASFRLRMLAMPVRCALRVMNLKTYAEVEGCLREHVHEALNELSRYDPEQHNPIDLEEGSELGGTATEPADQPVGGSVPPAE
jgi:phage terminase Nu1 subunit (DNA packaging protein)